MSKYAFLKGSLSLAIAGLVIGLFVGFKIANSQYRSQQGESLRRAVTQTAGGMAGSAGAGGGAAKVTAILDRAKANPGDADAQMDAASQFIQIERPREALPFLQQANKARPDDPRIHAGLGVAHFMLGEFNEATSWLKRSRELGATEPTVTSLLIGSYIQTRQNLDEADRLLKELEGRGISPDKLAAIRQDLVEARAGRMESRSVLDHGPENPKSPNKPAQSSGGKN
jgi:Flp pilus assembly protein TadD